MTRPVDGASTQREGGEGNRRRRDRHRRGERGDRHEARPVEPGADHAGAPVAQQAPAPSALAAAPADITPPMLAAARMPRVRHCAARCVGRAPADIAPPMQPAPQPAYEAPRVTEPAEAETVINLAVPPSSRRDGNPRAGTAACAAAASAGDAASGVDVAAGGFGSRAGRDAIEGDDRSRARTGGACGTAPCAPAARGDPGRAAADRRDAQGRSAARRLTFTIADREEGGPRARLSFP